jgi:hypothetical protein
MSPPRLPKFLIGVATVFFRSAHIVSTVCGVCGERCDIRHTHSWPSSRTCVCLISFRCTELDQFPTFLASYVVRFSWQRIRNAKFNHFRHDVLHHLPCRLPQTSARRQAVLCRFVIRICGLLTILKANGVPRRPSAAISLSTATCAIANNGRRPLPLQLADDGQLLISIADAGLAENADRIFDVFSAAESQGTRSGLGDYLFYC